MAIIIVTTSVPNAVQSVAYSYTIQTTGGVAPLAFSISAGALPTGITLNATSGLLSGTATTPGTYNFTVEVEDSELSTDTQAYTFEVYAPLETSPDPTPPATSVVLSAGDQVQFSVTGGSGNYQWSVDGGNIINPFTGLLTGINGGEYTVTVIDLESGQVSEISINILSQAQFCVQGTATAISADDVADNCCEFNVECGDRLQLRIPSFHVVEAGDKKPVLYSNLVQTVTGDASALQSTSAGAGASGNEVSFSRDAYFEIVTSFDMAQTANDEIAVGWSNTDADTSIASIDHAVVWFTDTGDRKIEIRHNGVPEAGSDFAIAQGDAVTFGVIGGEMQLWINSILVFTSAEDMSACGNSVLDIAITEANKTIGGFVSNLSWSIVTGGNSSQVGSIDANGVYTSPPSPIAGVVRIKGTVNNADFFVNVRNIQPTPRYTKAQPFLAGRRAHVWVTNQKATDTDVIRIASDGSPDAIQNPGMIYLGVLEGSATFTEAIEYQDFDNDEGTYYSAVASEKASLTGTFLEVRDFDKLALMMQHATLHPLSKGVREISVGGKTCGTCDLRVVMIVESGACGTGWDVIYLPRVQNNANLNLEIGKKTNAKYELNFKVLPDTSRPLGKQLYSIYQIENCGDDGNQNPCSVGE